MTRTLIAAGTMLQHPARRKRLVAGVLFIATAFATLVSGTEAEATPSWDPATVTVRAVPPPATPDGDIEMPLLATGTLDDLASSGLLPDPAAVDAYLNENGELEAHVAVFDPTGRALAYQYTLLVPPASRDGVWSVRRQIPDPAGPGTPVRETVESETSMLTVEVPFTSLDAVEIDASVLLSTTASAGAHDDYCYSWEDPFLRSTTSYSREDVPVVRIYTRGRTHWDYDWTNGRGTTHEVRTSAGDYVGFRYSADKTQNLNIGWSGDNYDAYVLKIENRYRRYNIYCHNITTYENRYSGKYEYHPYDYTGGDDTTSNSSVFSCQSAYTVKKTSSSMTIESSTSVRWNNWIDIGGIKLDDRVYDNAYASITLKREPGYSGSWYVCGSNNVPAKAAQIREK